MCGQKAANTSVDAGDDAKKKSVKKKIQTDARIFLSARGVKHAFLKSSFRGRILIHAHAYKKKRAEKIVIRENDGFRALRSGRVGGLDAFEKSKSDGGK